MFISEKEAELRLRKSENLFSSSSTPQIEEPENEPLPEHNSVQVLEPDEIQDSEEDAGENQGVASNSHVVTHRFRGRTKGAKTTPDFLRPIIGAAAKLGTIKEAAETFGMSTSTVGHLAQGRVHNGEQFTERPEVKSKLEAIIGKAQEDAADRLLKALGCITDEKLEGAKAGDLSRIAADMSRVIEKTTEKKAYVGAQIVILAPQVKSEDKFEVIEG